MVKGESLITCTNGHQSPDGSRFCLSCGLLLSDASSEVNAPSLPNEPSVLGMSQSAVLDQTPRKRAGWVIPVVVLGGLIVLGVAVVGMVNIASGSNPITQEPQVTPLDVSLTVFNEDGCDFGWGYDDVPGSTVTVSVDGIPVAFDQLPRFGEDNVVFCDFKVSIPGVPTDGNIYEIEIGRRGKAVQSRAELIESNWSYSASLGL